ncbi:MAG TPA: FISUMP domain-containing protein [Chitinivibrionales bacterium]
MKIKMALFPFLVYFTVCHAQTFNLSGTVKNGAGSGVEGVMVRLGKADIMTTTGADGSFKLTGSSTGAHARTNPGALSNNCPYTLDNNKLFISAREQTQIKVSVYDCNGKLLLSQSAVTVSGDQAIALPRFANGMHIYRIFMNTSQYTFKSVTETATDRTLGSSGNMATAARQAKATAQVDDALLFTKAGYQLYRLPVTKTDASGLQATMVALVTGTVADGEGNSYQTVQFGKKVWTIDNFRATKYNDKSAISGYYFYQNATDDASKKKWGALYSGDVAKSSKLAPSGWHVATDADWDTLQNYLISSGYNYDGALTENKIAKSMATTTDWQTSKETGAVGNDATKNNGSGFSAVPGGLRNYDGSFFDQKVIGYFWSSTQKDATYTYYRIIYYTNFDLYKSYRINSNACSIRLVKN